VRLASRATSAAAPATRHRQRRARRGQGVGRWPAITKQSGIGASVLRKEDAPLITGQGRYVDDITLPGMAFAAFARSAHAHAVIKSVDTSAAEAMPGVDKVFTYATLGLDAGVPCAFQPDRRRRHVRRPISPTAGCAWSVSRSRWSWPIRGRPRAMRPIASSSTTTPLPVVIDAENAVKPGAPQLHDECAGQPLLPRSLTRPRASTRRSTPRRQGLADDDNQRLTPVPIEPRAVVADWITSSGELTSTLHPGAALRAHVRWPRSAARPSRRCA